MGTRVELFEQIRRDHDREELSIHELARRHRVHRRTVRQALDSPLPPPRKKPEGRSSPVLGPYHGLIDEWLEGDRTAPPKQRHTAKRIWERLITEKGAKVAQRTVREHVAQRRRELGLPASMGGEGGMKLHSQFKPPLWGQCRLPFSRAEDREDEARRRCGAGR